MSDNARRKLLKSIAAGSGAIVAGKTLPDSWSRPVVDTVILPVHAQTSGGIYSASGIPTSTTAPVEQFNQETQLARLVDSLVPEANAGNGGGSFEHGWYACAMVSGSSVFVSVAGLGGKGVHDPSETLMIRRGTLDIGGAEGTITATGGDVTSCLDPSESQLTRPARIDSVSSTEVVLQVIRTCVDEGGCDGEPDFIELIIPRNDAGCVPEPPVAFCT